MMQHVQVVGYVRVSSTDQNTARQLEAIGEVDRVFEEKVSGGSRVDRAALAECLAYVRAGDTVRVASMDRLARSVVDLRAIVDEVLDKGASVQFVKEGQTYTPDSADALSRLLLHMLGAFAEFERSLIRERQAEGIRIAKAAGKYRGRQRALSVADADRVKALVAAGMPKARIAREFGVNRSTIYRLLDARDRG